jgi:hypothetical protein
MGESNVSDLMIAMCDCAVLWINTAYDNEVALNANHAVLMRISKRQKTK